jgi:hypothetical protein
MLSSSPGGQVEAQDPPGAHDAAADGIDQRAALYQYARILSPITQSTHQESRILWVCC